MRFSRKAQRLHAEASKALASCEAAGLADQDAVISVTSVMTLRRVARAWVACA